MVEEVILEMSDISKSFPGVKALENAQLKVESGSVHALMGENGAGKSTLMNILAGIYIPDTGKITVGGNAVEFRNPQDSLQSGISMIHQELTPVEELSIAENVFLGREPTKKLTKLIDYNELFSRTKVLLDQLNLNLNPRTKMGNLSISQVQMIEIAKALSHDSKLIIMDEPTSALTDTEVALLFKSIKGLTKQGKSIIYISHKLDEIFEITDKITVFRDGNYVGTKDTSETNNEELIEMMVGRKMTNVYPEKKVNKYSGTILEMKNVTVKNKLKNINLHLKKGEILGLTGLMGSGRTELAETLFGIHKLEAGKIFIDNKEAEINNPKSAMRYGISFVTEDRKEEGLFLELSIKDNIVISSLGKHNKLGVILDDKKLNSISEDSVSRLRVKTNSLYRNVETLSGGNQQKVVLAKWLLRDPKVLILDEPTRGVDVGAKLDIYNIMYELVQRGFSIILISSETPEVLNLSDRVLVFKEGQISGELEKNEMTKENVFRYY